MATSPYLPLDSRGWRLAMGLRPLDLAMWLEVDEQRADQLALKRDLLVQNYDAVVATHPEGDAASAELLAVVADHLRAYHLNTVVEIDDTEHPLVSASRLVQEDLCVLVREDAWRLRAACVCFPSRWRLADKIGATLDDIHAPVPGYDDELARPTTALFDRLRADRSFWRLNWTLLDSPALFQPASPRRTPSGRLEDWYFRVERQTLRALPLTGAVVFTIRTYVTSAATLGERDDNFLSTLALALDTAPASVQSYKGWTGVGERLRDALMRES